MAVLFDINRYSRFHAISAAAVVSIILGALPLLVIYLSRDIRKQENSSRRTAYPFALVAISGVI